jgi:hypothetical protein
MRRVKNTGTCGCSCIITELDRLTGRMLTRRDDLGMFPMTTGLDCPSSMGRLMRLRTRETTSALRYGNDVIEKKLTSSQEGYQNPKK